MIIEEIVLNYLNENLDAPVLMEVPLDVEPVETYVVLRRQALQKKILYAGQPLQYNPSRRHCTKRPLSIFASKKQCVILKRFLRSAHVY